jgi:hypothetical protein
MATAVSRLRAGFRRKVTEDEVPTVPMTGLSSDEKNPAVTGTDDTIAPSSAAGEPAGDDLEKDIVPTEDAQRGVQQVEAVTLTWTKPYLIAVFIL